MKSLKLSPGYQFVNPGEKRGRGVIQSNERIYIFYFTYWFFYSLLKIQIVISERDGYVNLKQVLSFHGSLELI
jgi:hypothetical protein